MSVGAKKEMQDRIKILTQEKGGPLFRHQERDDRARVLAPKVPEKFSLDSGLGDRELGNFLVKKGLPMPRGGYVAQAKRINNDYDEQAHFERLEKALEYLVKE